MEKVVAVATLAFAGSLSYDFGTTVIVIVLGYFSE